ncbi:PTS sugar transporter subunit IIA [Lapidilactobacillus bayanensis]|uniref:PTS sugar transporter subunit IIA n=1 Tax=Lapidilactobacillus bayanensis TaxID=2485998 RepID=UPI000F7A30F1|nr:hypothetical protein [Lapidilactobacillus bayanensis]
MKQLVLISHGNVAASYLQSLDMIAGSHHQVTAITFDGEISKAELGQQMVEQVGSDEAIIVADLPGGTPCNVALEQFMNNDKVTILASLNLPMLLELYLNLNNTDFQIPQAVATGQDNIFDVKIKMRATAADDE